MCCVYHSVVPGKDAGGAIGSNNRPVFRPTGDIIVLGLKWDITEDGLKSYFTQFGKVDHAEVRVCVCLCVVSVCVRVCVRTSIK